MYKLIYLCRIFRERIDERKLAPHIIDSHETLVRRWYIRRLFYKECEYNIQHLDRPKKVVAAEPEANKHGCMIKL